MGDFPIDHLYHVYDANNHKLGVVDDWPANWTRDPFKPTNP